MNAPTLITSLILSCSLTVFSTTVNAQDPNTRHLSKQEVDSIRSALEAELNTTYEYIRRKDWGEVLPKLTLLVDLEHRLPKHNPYKTRVLQIRSVAYSKMGAPLVAAEITLKEIRLLEIKGELERAPIVFGRYGGYLLEGGDFAGAITAFKNQFESEKRNQPTDSMRWVSAINNIGYAYYKSGDSEGALKYLYRAKNILETNGSNSMPGLYASILDNLGLVFAHSQDWSSALSFFEESYEILYELNRKPRIAKSLIQLGWVYTETDQKQPADSLFALAEDLIRSLNSLGPQPELELLYLDHKLRFTKKFGAENEILIANNRLLHYQDSLLQIQTKVVDKTLSQAQALMDIVQHNQRRLAELRTSEAKRALQAERVTKNLIIQRLILGILVVILIVGILLVYYKTRSTRLKLSLKEKEQDATNFALEITRKREWIESLLARLESIDLKGEDTNELKSLLLDMKRSSKVDEKHQKVLENVEEVNSRFYSLLRGEHPDLTDNDLQLCGMIKLGMSTKEISEMRSVTPNAVKVARRRLRKKLGLSPADDLIKHLSTLS